MIPPRTEDRDRLPLSTYRMGFHKDFRLSQATHLLSYLEKLGITTLYASPLFSSRTGSVHGYDVTDPTRLNPEIGTTADMERLAAGLASRKMGLILDIVPNHMAAHFENPWWRDLLENGESSPYAMVFDVDWYPPQRALEHRISLPILGLPYERSLTNRELSLVYEKSGFAVRYFTNSLPVEPASLLPVLLEIRSHLPRNAQEETLIAQEGLSDLVKEVGRIPPPSVSDENGKRLRARSGKALKTLFQRLYRTSPVFREALERTLAEYNGIRGIPSSFDRMDSLLNRQVYWLSHWKTVTRTLNYRRFFDVADLVGVRAEDERVFEMFHRLVRDWSRKGWIVGVRVDHVDGLQDPAAYLVRLAGALKEELAGHPPLIWVEKILAAHESLPPEWPTMGTTGYEFANRLTSLFGDPEGVERLRRWYSESIDPGAVFSDIVYHQKKYICETLLGGELRRLALRLEWMAQEEREVREFGLRELQSGLVEVTACLAVYRTYVQERTIREADRKEILAALERARRRHLSRKKGLFRFLERVLTLSFPADATEEKKWRWLHFVEKWQQFTGPVMAKGVEDTAFYLYSPLISANEVGGDPSLAPIDTPDFHTFNRDRLDRFPLTLSATSTHDTKRSEDVRARIQILSEHAGEWMEHVTKWRSWNRKARIRPEGMADIPDPSLELFLYQTMAGAWPLNPEELPKFKTRLSDYLVKVVRESKRNTNWISPDTDYEAAVCRFAKEVCRANRKSPFLASFLDFQRKVAQEGACASLCQLLLKMTSPGICDFYQGSELWDLSLVDPDNRRPVDYAKRISLLGHIQSAWAKDPAGTFRALLTDWQDGQIKLFLTQAVLRLRKRHPALFLEGDYRPLPPEWEKKNHMLGFLRRHSGTEILVVVSLRASGRLEKDSLLALSELAREGEIPLPADSQTTGWRQLFTRKAVRAGSSGKAPSLSLEQAMCGAPFSVLVRESSPGTEENEQ